MNYLSKFVSFVVLCLLCSPLQAQKKEVTGENSTHVEFSTDTEKGYFYKKSSTHWVEYSTAFEGRKHYTESGRDAWSIYLEDADIKGRQVQIDLHQRLINENNKPSRKVRNAFTDYEPNANLWYYIETLNGKRVDITMSSMKDGTNIIVYSPNPKQSDANQQFKFVGRAYGQKEIISKINNKKSLTMTMGADKKFNIDLRSHKTEAGMTQVYKLLKGDGNHIYIQPASSRSSFLGYAADGNLVLFSDASFATGDHMKFILKKADSDLIVVKPEPKPKPKPTKIINVNTVGFVKCSNDFSFHRNWIKVTDEYWVYQVHKDEDNPTLITYREVMKKGQSIFLEGVNHRGKAEISFKKNTVTMSKAKKPMPIYDSKLRPANQNGKVYTIKDVKWKMINEEDGSTTPAIYGHVKITLYDSFDKKTVKQIKVFNRGDKAGARVSAKKGYVEYCSGSITFAIPHGYPGARYGFELNARLSDWDRSSSNDLIGDQTTVVYPFSNLNKTAKKVVLDMRSSDGDIDVSCIMQQIQ